MSLPQRMNTRTISPRRPGGRQIIQNEGYNVVGAMACQRNALSSIQALDTAGDEMRRQLHSALIQQRRAFAEGQTGLAVGLNQVALALLGVVNQLDAAEDENPLSDAYTHNQEAAESGRRIISATEGAELAPIVA